MTMRRVRHKRFGDGTIFDSYETDSSSATRFLSKETVTVARVIFDDFDEPKDIIDDPLYLTEI